MLRKAMTGAVAGLAGTAALNAVTYLDMVLRGRPASTAPQRAVAELANRGNISIPGSERERSSRLQGAGALAGTLTGVLVGAAAGQSAPVLRKLGPVLGPVAAGGAAMAATDASMLRLGVSDPRSWDASGWLSDAIPHLAYGMVTWAVLAQLTAPRPGRLRAPLSAAAGSGSRVRPPR